MLFAALGSSGADTVILKNGRKYKNVKVSIRRHLLIIRMKNGRRVVLKKRKIKTFRRSPVVWKKKATEKPVAKKTVIEEPVAKGPVREVPVFIPVYKNEVPENIGIPDPQIARGTLWWSFLAPGVGHFREGETFKGALLLGGFVAATGGVAALWEKNKNISNNFDQTTTNGLMLVPLILDAPIGTEVLIYPFYMQAVEQRHKNQVLQNRIVAVSVVAIGVYLFNFFDAIYPLEKLFQKTVHRPSKTNNFALTLDLQTGQAANGNLENQYLFQISYRF